MYIRLVVVFFELVLNTSVLVLLYSEASFGSAQCVSCVLWLNKLCMLFLSPVLLETVVDFAFCISCPVSVFK